MRASPDEVLVAEISGGRPDTARRSTERFEGFGQFPHIIVSNNSEGYVSGWQVVDVPDRFREWYMASMVVDARACGAPMGRSYAMAWAREHGYRYLVQLDDNITQLQVLYERKGPDGITARYTTSGNGVHGTRAANFVRALVTVLECTDAGVAGMNMTSLGPTSELLRERYVYSFFAMDLTRCDPCFWGGFEDDIEYRAELAGQGVPYAQLVPFRYGKAAMRAKRGADDVSGNRQAYKDAGLGRGEAMRRIHGDSYECGLGTKAATTTDCEPVVQFRHRLKDPGGGKVGLRVERQGELEAEVRRVLREEARPVGDYAKLSEVAEKA